MLQFDNLLIFLLKFITTVAKNKLRKKMEPHKDFKKRK